MSGRPEVLVALLRGVNVGGRNKLPMARLRAIVEGVGGRCVTTYIQSGNAVFQAPGVGHHEVARSIARSLAEAESLEVPVLVRTLAELRSVVDANPFLAAGVDPRELHVLFLAEAPTSQQLATLDPARSPGDEFASRGGEIYLRCPNGMARTKLTNAYFDARLETTSTGRNWRTTLELLARAERCAATRWG